MLAFTGGIVAASVPPRTNRACTSQWRAQLRVIGSGLLLLSALWHPARAHVDRLFPEGLRQRLPPLR
jgi:hypothetical protein